MCELGAIWGASKRSIPVLFPPLSYEDMAGVLGSVKALRANNKADLDNVFDEVTKTLSIQSTSSASTWNQHVPEFISSLSIHYRKLTVERAEGINFLNQYVYRIATALNNTRRQSSGKHPNRKESYFVVFDIDGMSSFNKQHGVHNGDRVLSYLSKYVKDNEKKEFIIGGRCGDDTFYVLFWGTRSQAKRLCESFLKIVVESTEKLGMTMWLTASGAITTFDGSTHMDHVITSANNALIEARTTNGGDNCVVGEEPDAALPINLWS